MKRHRFEIRFAVSIAVILLGLALHRGSAATIQQMSFEDSLRGSDLVVLGKIIDSPEIGVFDRELGVRREHRVRVTRYVKGDGPDEIAVITRGGRYWKNTEKGPVLYEGTSEAAPQLPPPGSEVVLFLRTWGGGYLIYSASHGVIPVKTEPDGSQVVWFHVENPDVMPPDARASDEAASTTGVAPGGTLYRARVNVQELKRVADRVLGRLP